MRFGVRIAVAPGATEYLTIQTTSANFSSYVVAYREANSYPAGVASYNGNVLNPNYDLTFRTYSDTTFSSAVPEPSTWAMMLLGFAGLGYLAYHRKAASGLAA